MDKIAIPIWDNRISPVLDTAARLLVIELNDGHEVSRETITIPTDRVPDRIRIITQLGVSAILCGAVSRPLHTLLSQAQIRVVPFVTGPVEEILSAYLEGNLEKDKYLLPGCGRNRRGCGQGRRRGRGCRRGDNSPLSEDKK